MWWVDHKQPAAVEPLKMNRAAPQNLHAQNLGACNGGDGAMKPGHGLGVLDRVPSDVYACSEAAQRLGQAVDHALKLAVLLKRWIDEDEPAPLLGRQLRLERQPAVKRQDLDPAVAADGGLQPCMLLGVQLVGDQHVVGAHQAAGDQRAAGVNAKIQTAVLAADRVEIRPEAPGDGRWQWPDAWSQEPADATLPLAGLVRLLRIERIAPAAGVRVDDAEGRRFALQVLDNESEHDMLQHVREIAGMIGMTVVHGIVPSVSRQSAKLTRPRYLLCGTADFTNGFLHPWRYLASSSANPGSPAWTNLALARATRCEMRSVSKTCGNAQVNSMKARLSFLAASRETSP